MRWENKCKELIQYANDVCAIFKQNSGFYVFGAGDIGRSVYVALSKFGLFKGFIDNDKKKQSTGFLNEKVYSYLEFIEKGDNALVIIAATHKNEKAIENQLMKDGINYISANVFLDRTLPTYLFFDKNILMMHLSQICVTERCSLRCEKCAHACYAVDKESKDLSLEEVKTTADEFFRHIDYILEFVLIGGEPLLYNYLNDAISYIAENYGNKIGIFSITTNGTILPGSDLIETCRKYNVFWRISNYSVSLPRLTEKYEKLVGILEENNIDHYLGKPEEEWWDYGFDVKLPLCSTEELIRRFDECATPCRETRNGKLYFCVMARTVSDNLKLNIGKDDYLDLEKLPEGDFGRRLLFEYNMGYSEKGFLSMCARCRGKDCVNYPVMAAKQAERSLL